MTSLVQDLLLRMCPAATNQRLQALQAKTVSWIFLTIHHLPWQLLSSRQALLLISLTRLCLDQTRVFKPQTRLLSRHRTSLSLPKAQWEARSKPRVSKCWHRLQDLTRTPASVWSSSRSPITQLKCSETSCLRWTWTTSVSLLTRAYPKTLWLPLVPQLKHVWRAALPLSVMVSLLRNHLFSSSAVSCARLICSFSSCLP